MIDFTVVIPVYNSSPACLVECIYSAINQTIKQNYKILIVDDGSTNEETIKAIELFTYHPKVMTRFLGENGGTSAALNYAHELVDSEFIALLGSEDIFDRNKLQLQTEYLQRNRHVSVLGTQLFSFEHTDIHRAPLWTSSHKLIPKVTDNPSNQYFIANHGTVLYNNQHVKDAGAYNLDFRRGQDVDLWKRMYSKGMIFHCMQQVLYGWRKFNVK